MTFDGLSFLGLETSVGMEHYHYVHTSGGTINMKIAVAT